MNRTHLLKAGQAISLTEATLKRELDRVVNAVPAEADKLIAYIEAMATGRPTG
jgi:hypothetical protein